MIATPPQGRFEQSCKAPPVGGAANLLAVTGLESDTEFVKSLCRWAKTAPSTLAKDAGLAATTLLRPYRGTATTRISQPTFDKLRSKFPDYPGWRREHPDQIGMLGERADPNERPGELIYVRQVDIVLAMGEPAPIEEYPATDLVPFNLGFIRAITNADTEKLLLFTGHGESMEPTLLRSDLLMIDTGNRSPSMSDQIWAFHYAGGGMVKRLRRIKESGRDMFLILSDNPAVPAQVAGIEDVHVIGKLVWVGRRI